MKSFFMTHKTTTKPEWIVDMGIETIWLFGAESTVFKLCDVINSLKVLHTMNYFVRLPLGKIKREEQKQGYRE